MNTDVANLVGRLAAERHHLTQLRSWLGRKDPVSRFQDLAGYRRYMEQRIAEVSAGVVADQATLQDWALDGTNPGRATAALCALL